MKKRTRLQLYHEILELLSSGPKGKTQIVYGCNLGFRPAAGYLRDLAEKGLVEGAPERQFRITAKGLATLGTMEKLEKLGALQ